MKLIFLKYLLFALGLLFVWKYNTQKNQIQTELNKKRQADSLVQAKSAARFIDSLANEVKSIKQE